MSRRVQKIAVTLTMLTLVGGSLVSASSTECDVIIEQDHLVGQACTAEMISMPTLWSQDSDAVLPSQKFLFLFTALLLIVTVVFPRITRESRGLTWFNRRLNFTRGSPTWQSLFLPYLFATHGW